LEEAKAAVKAGAKIDLQPLYQRLTQIKDAQWGLYEKARNAGVVGDVPALRELTSDEFGKIGSTVGMAVAAALGSLWGGRFLPPKGGALKPPPRRVGGYINPKRMKRKEVKCFKKNTKGSPKEYDRQLADQEKGLNDMSVQEYLDGRQRYQEIGRQGTGEAQAQARAKYQNELTQKYKAALNEQGITGAAAQQQASAQAAQEMKTLDALHNPDMIAGGQDVIGGMGDSGVNRSIGAQWGDRIDELDQAARQVPESERASTKMNAKLNRCP